jgi:hypothetical protein
MDTKNSPFDKAVPHDFGTPFADMSTAAKWTFIAKLIVCVATFGFAFPNVQKS